MFSCKIEAAVRCCLLLVQLYICLRTVSNAYPVDRSPTRGALQTELQRPSLTSTYPTRSFNLIYDISQVKGRIANGRGYRALLASMKAMLGAMTSHGPQITEADRRLTCKYRRDKHFLLRQRLRSRRRNRSAARSYRMTEPTASADLSVVVLVRYIAHKSDPT